VFADSQCRGACDLMGISHYKKINNYMNNILKWALCILIILFAMYGCIELLFLNNKVYDFWAKIDKEKLLSNLSSIGAFITSIIALFTLFSLKKQRKESIRPIIILYQGAYAICEAENGWLLKSKWKDGETDSEYLSIKIKNAGVGFAQNIQIIESFDLNKAIRYIKKLDSNNEFDISLEGEKLRITTSFDDTFILNFNFKYISEGFTKLPYGQDKDGDLTIPNVYLSLLSCFSYLKEKNQFLDLKYFPKIEYTIKFEDVEGKAYSSKYKISAYAINSSSFSISAKKT